MSIRPSQQTDTEPEVIEFGIAAFDAHLDDTEVSFPATADELIDKLDDAKIPIDAHGNERSLSTVLEEVERNEFKSKRELQNDLHPVFESYRDSASSSMLASIRALIPF